MPTSVAAVAVRVDHGAMPEARGATNVEAETLQEEAVRLLMTPSLSRKRKAAVAVPMLMCGPRAATRVTGGSSSRGMTCS